MASHIERGEEREEGVWTGHTPFGGRIGGRRCKWMGMWKRSYEH